MNTIRELRKETGVPVVIADEEGLINYVNQRFEKVFGWPANEIVGRPLTTIIPRNLHDAHHLGFSRFLTTGKPTLLNQALKLKAVTKAGQEFEAEHMIIAEREKNQWIFGASIRPLGEKGA